MYASLLISLLAAFIAMLGKQWLNRYLRNSGGSMIDRCGDRQRKCDGLEKWPLHLFVKSLPMMLQVALLLLACGLCRRIWSINTSAAYILVGLTGLGVAFYVAIVIAGASSYASPFQTPVSIALRSPWKRVRRGIVSCISHSTKALLRTRPTQKWRVWPLIRRQSLPMISLANVQVHQCEPWLKPKDLGVVRRTNANDVRCVSWILRNITDPEALDTAIRLAGMIRWFDDGTDVDPPYDVVVSAFEACFDSNRKLYPGSRDQAYYSGRAILWIHTLATCKSKAFEAPLFLPTAGYTAPGFDPDLKHLLDVSASWSIDSRFSYSLMIHPGCTPSHSQWISNVLLHHSWAHRSLLGPPRYASGINEPTVSGTHRATIPLNATLNCLLAWCIFLGSPVEEEALKVRDKSYGIS